MLLRRWMLVLLVCVSAFAPSRADARAAENRTWVFLPTVTETRLETEPQVAGTHQENRVWGYEHAPGCTQAAERTALAAGDDMVTVYRGVHPRHPDLPSALQGRANPIGGHADAALHNAGNNQSVFTSWTTDRATAFDFAVGKYSGFDEAGGVLLQQRVPRSSLIRSPDAFGEFEVLRSGPVSGATPIIISR